MLNASKLLMPRWMRSSSRPAFAKGLDAVRLWKGNMNSEAQIPLFGNVADASKNTRGWFLGHFMPGEANSLRTSELEAKWYTHAKGETRHEWAPGNPVKTVNILIRGHFVLLFPDREVALEQEGDFVLFGPGVPHSFRSVEESLVLTLRWPSLPQQ